MWLECERGNEEIAAVPVPGSSLHERQRHGKVTTVWGRQNRICGCESRKGIIRKDEYKL